MESPLLNDPQIHPTPEVLKYTLNEAYSTYEQFIKTITAQPFQFEPQWNYYKDGKAWLCKVVYKKKTMFWLSVWDGYFKIGFYFTDKHKTDINALSISEKIKDQFNQAKYIGKLIPLGITFKDTDIFTDAQAIMLYKKSLK